VARSHMPVPQVTPTRNAANGIASRSQGCRRRTAATMVSKEMATPIPVANHAYTGPTKLASISEETQSMHARGQDADNERREAGSPAFLPRNDRRFVHTPAPAFRAGATATSGVSPAAGRPGARH
jgi:hypothetical protein